MPAKKRESAELDLAMALGAAETFALNKLTIYLPNKDRDQKPVANIDAYIRSAMELLASINLGVTRLPPSQGMWVNDQTGTPIYEETVLVYSFIKDPAAFSRRHKEIKAFLHRFGQDTNQGEVMVEFSGESANKKKYFSRAYSIRHYQVPEHG